MGILNVTPDSFSDGGECLEPEAAVRAALRMEREGVDFIDVGAESTRPGAEGIPAEEEWRRLEPVLGVLRGEVSVPLSVDTYKASVAGRALAAGASIVNDIDGFLGDPEMAAAVAEAGAGVVLMHNSRERGIDGRDIVGAIQESWEASLEAADRAGVARDRIVLDPGIGFGKTVEENLAILRRFPEFRETGFPLLLGASRKSVIGKVLGLSVGERLEGTLATTVAGIVGGADVIRVHEIDPNLKAARMADAIFRSDEST